jgi:hypothetical protein
MKAQIGLPVRAVPGDGNDAMLIDSYGATVAVFFPNGDEDTSAFDNARLCAAVLNNQTK